MNRRPALNQMLSDLADELPALMAESDFPLCYHRRTQAIIAAAGPEHRDYVNDVLRQFASRTPLVWPGPVAAETPQRAVAA